MEASNFTIGFCLATMVVIVAWDLLVMSMGKSNETWCNGMRRLNRITGGLLALFALALWIHTFCFSLLPIGWK